MNVEEKVKQFFEERNLVEESPAVVVAVSGGVDSVVLLHVLLRLSSDNYSRLGVAHFDHQIRGEASRQDARFVENQAEEKGLPFFSQSEDIPCISECRGLSLEEAARDARYVFFDRLVKKEGFDYVALGHNKNDQAETVLMNLIRGTGVGGLGGMQQVRDHYIRPLLSCRRDSILDYARKQNLSWRVDKTNRDTDYLRNRIRHKLIPCLEEEYNEAIVDSLARTASILREADDFINRETTAVWDDVVITTKEGCIRFNSARLVQYHPFMVKEVIRYGIERVKGDLANITFSHVNEIFAQLVQNKPRGEIALPDGVLFVKERDRASLCKERTGELSGFSYQIQPPGKVTISEINRELAFDVIRNRPGEQDIWVDKPHGTGYVDWSKVGSSITIRNRRKGDKFRPLGMEGHKKLKDFFIDEKVPLRKRDKIPLVCNNGEIMWVAGYRISEKYKVDQQTTEILRMRVREK